LRYMVGAHRYFVYGIGRMWRERKLFWAFLLFCQMSPLPWAVDLVIFGFILYNLAKEGKHPVLSKIAITRVGENA